ncbi:hypothetical protein [Alteribacter populi]|uniref:hypothetical protein n=1 Tax=Alteribacter populi TaxID=2011011 RepID=UPI000BBB130E|nr:hypothetical protein [Alteribacter populi]
MNLQALRGLLTSEQERHVNETRLEKGLPALFIDEEADRHNGAREILKKIGRRQQKMLDEIMMRPVDSRDSFPPLQTSLFDQQALQRLRDTGVVFSLSDGEKETWFIPREWETAFYQVREKKAVTHCSEQSGLFFWTSLAALQQYFIGNKNLSKEDRFIVNVLRRTGWVIDGNWQVRQFEKWLSYRFDDFLEMMIEALFESERADVRGCIKDLIHGCYVPMKTLTEKGVTSAALESFVDRGVLIKEGGKIRLSFALDRLYYDRASTIIDLGNFEWIIPQSIDVRLIWEVLKWGDLDWNKDSFETGVAHVIFTKESVQRAVDSGESLDDFFETFYSVFIDLDRYRSQFEQWQLENEPIKENETYTYFSILDSAVEPICLKTLSRENIPYISAAGGVFVKEQEVNRARKVFESSGFLKKQLAEKSSEEKIPIKKWKIEDGANRSHPYSAEIDLLPRQWFSMLGYSEKMVLKIIRQALSLHLPLRFKVAGEEKSIFAEIERLCVTGEACPYFLTKDNQSYYVERLVAISIVHPDEIELYLREEGLS